LNTASSPLLSLSLSSAPSPLWAASSRACLRRSPGVWKTAQAAPPPPPPLR